MVTGILSPPEGEDNTVECRGQGLVLEIRGFRPSSLSRKAGPRSAELPTDLGSLESLVVTY